MSHRSLTGVILLAAAVMVTVSIAQAADEAKYPNWKGEWNAVNPRMPGQQLRFDPTKPYGPGQQAPLTEEYRKIWQENLAEQAEGGQGLFLDHASCLPAGMPTMMSGGTQEYIVTPETDLCFGRHRSTPGFHRRTALADGPGTDLSGLFDGPVDRRGRRRRLRRA